MKISNAQLKSIIEDICQKEDIFCKKIVLFGSRARGDYNLHSDYDILVIVGEHININAKRNLANKIREKLAEKLIGADVIVKSSAEVKNCADKIGHIVRYAMREGVVL